MIGGNTRVNKDVAPYFLYSEFNIRPCGLNLVGLRRAGFAAAEIAALKKAYRLLFRENLPLENALRRIAEEAPTRAYRSPGRVHSELQARHRAPLKACAERAAGNPACL